MLIKAKPEVLAFGVAAKPFFDLEDVKLSQEVTVGQEWSFALPKGKHPDGDAVAVKYGSVKLGMASIFVDYDKDALQLSIEANVT